MRDVGQARRLSLLRHCCGDAWYDVLRESKKKQKRRGDDVSIGFESPITAVFDSDEGIHILI